MFFLFFSWPMIRRRGVQAVVAVAGLSTGKLTAFPVRDDDVSFEGV
jgi:hypothetical protein